MDFLEGRPDVYFEEVERRSENAPPEAEEAENDVQVIDTESDEVDDDQDIKPTTSEPDVRNTSFQEGKVGLF